MWKRKTRQGSKFLGEPSPACPGRSRLRTVLLLLLAWLCAGPLAAQSVSAPSVVVEADAVVVSGLTAGGRVAVLAVVRQDERYSGRTSAFRTELVDEDGDGTVRWVLEAGVTPKTLALAVDVSSGLWAWGSASGRSPAFEPLAAESWQLSPQQEVSGWRLPEGWLVTLLVRPGVGAWALEQEEGPSSIEIADGEVELAWPELTALGNEAAAPSSLAAGDRLLGLAPKHFVVYAATGAEAVAQTGGAR
jgi:hypothetical protein